MAFTVSFSPQARKQVRQLQRYLANRFYAENAERFIVRLLDECESLKFTPMRGTLREDIGPAIRSFGFERG